MLLLKLWGLAEVREAGSWLDELLTALRGEVLGCQSCHSHSFTWAVAAGGGGWQVWGVKSTPQDSWSTSDSYMGWFVCPASGDVGSSSPGLDSIYPLSSLEAVIRDSQQGHTFLSTQVAPPAHLAPGTNSPPSLTLTTSGTLPCFPPSALLDRCCWLFPIWRMWWLLLPCLGRWIHAGKAPGCVNVLVVVIARAVYLHHRGICLRGCCLPASVRAIWDFPATHPCWGPVWKGWP